MLARYGILGVLYLNFLCANSVIGCGVCNGSGTSLSAGLPQWKGSYLGLRYTTQTIHSGKTIEGIYQPSVKESFRSVEWTGRYMLRSRFILDAQIPFRINQQHINPNKIHCMGLGDLRFLGGLVIHRFQPIGKSNWQHGLQGGIGIKVPTGASTQLHNGLLIHPYLQPGSGSWDVPFYLNYLVRYKKLGIQSELGCQLNQANPQRIQLGNTYFQQVRILAQWDQKNVSFVPMLGLWGEWREADRYDQYIQSESEGYRLQALCSLDIYAARWGTGIQAQFPIQETATMGSNRNSPGISFQFVYFIPSF